ncbi:MAG: PAS domain-containing sensor histidine kinase [Rhizobiales bacterium]|nr:PAS domain-containing sensor histidine kinase [Hyphomicrobiales bacterium]
MHLRVGAPMADPLNEEPDAGGDREGFGEDRLAGISFRQRIENTTDGILILDTLGTVLYANPVAREVFDHPGDEPLRVSLGRPLQAGETADLTIYRRGRKPAEVEMRLVEVTWHGQPAFLGSLSDVSARRSREERLRQLERLEAVGHLTAGIVHDFNNLLAVVGSGLRLLHKRLDGLATDPEINPLFEEMQERVQNGSALSQQLLQLSHQHSSIRGTVDLIARIESLSHLLEQTLGKGIILRRELDRSIGSVLIDADELDTAILNLVVNARDAMDGRGTVTIETGHATADGEDLSADAAALARVTVADTGCGMSDEVLRKVFVPFFTTKAEGVGTGLGLPQVDDFVNRSGGKIRIDSSPGGGTKVHLFLPRVSGGAES